MRLGRDLTGQSVDLRAFGDSLPHEGPFRRMVLQSVERKLRKRGAREIILPE